MDESCGDGTRKVSDSRKLRCAWCHSDGANETRRSSIRNARGKEAPLGRVGMPEDVGNAVVFLASQQSSFVSGQTLWVDGATFTKPSWPYKLTNDERPQEAQKVPLASHDKRNSGKTDHPRR